MNFYLGMKMKEHLYPEQPLEITEIVDAPVCIADLTKRPDIFVLIAYYAPGPWWAVKGDGFSLKAVEETANRLASGWTKKRIYRIPGETK
jgi:hypothetical protein